MKEGTTIHLSKALEIIDNRAGLDPETVLTLVADFQSW